MKSKKEEKGFDIFSHWKYLTSKNEGWLEHDEEFKNSYNVYMINRLGSMFDVFVPFLAEVSRYDLPKESHFAIMNAHIPKRYLKVDYIKSKKLKNENDKYVSEYFECGSRDTELAMKLLNDATIIQIRKKFGGKDAKIS